MARPIRYPEPHGPITRAAVPYEVTVNYRPTPTTPGVLMDGLALAWAGDAYGGHVVLVRVGIGEAWGESEHWVSARDVRRRGVG